MTTPCAVVALSLLFQLSVAAPARLFAADTSFVSLQQRLDDARKEAEQLLKSQADLFEQLESIENELELSSKLVRSLRLQSRAVAAEIEATVDSLTALQHLSAAEEKVIAERLRHFYLHRPGNAPVLPLTVTRAERDQAFALYYERILVRDNLFLASLDLEITSQSELLDNLQKREQELAALTRSRRAEDERARQSLQQREKLLAQLKGEQRRVRLELETLESQSTTLGEIFAELEAQALEVSDDIRRRQRELSLRLKGKAHWPVKGRVAVSFGTQRDRRTGLTHKSNGIVITAKPSANVVAAMTGQVLYIGWARGLERFVVVDHGGSIYSLYGYLADIKVREGDPVIRGETFATTAGDRLHFEVRDGRLPVNPLDWLKE